MPAQNYERDKNGIRLDLTGGMNTMLPADLMEKGFPYLQNVRRNLAGRIVSRPALGSNYLSTTIGSPTSMILMNDPYTGPAQNVPASVLIVGAPGALYTGILVGGSTVMTQRVSGATFALSPLSFITFRPNASPRPWCYTADPSMSVAIPGNALYPAYPATIYGNPISAMVKVRSDGVVFKTGIAEPQIAPIVSLAGGLGPNWVTYRYVFRSSVTGALSNPSPESAALVMLQASTPVATIPAQDPTRILYNHTQWDASAPPQLRTINEVNGQITDYVTATGFGFTIPAGVPIQGIRVTLDWNGQVAGTGLLVNASLFYQGNILGTTKNPNVLNQQVSTGVNTFVGGISDDWGAGSLLSAGVVNDSTFGFGIQIQEFNVGGISRSFIQSMSMQVFYANQNAGVTATISPDPQVDKVDFYRSGPGLENFTYVGTVANVADPAHPTLPNTVGLVDTLSDLGAAANPVLDFDNYEPFPSIDLPRSGTCTITPVNQHVTAIDITSEGSGQTDGTYNIPSSGGGGTGAVVQITISGGIITNAVIPPGSSGSGYTSDPTFPVVFGGTPGQLAAGISPILPITPNITQTGGDPFNVRWLPGTTILLGGYPGPTQQTAWTLYNRPTSASALIAFQSIIDVITGLPALSFPTPATGVQWSISEPALAQQASPVIWGPTPESQGSQASFYFGLDPNNPGDLLWSKGNNFDSAPDTNRVNVTSPSEMLMNGVVTSEINAVFSTERFWLIYPNFADAVATVTGIEGSQWTLIQAQATRGLYMRYAIAALGSTIAYRAKDCIAVSSGGSLEESITDDLYNLFPHGGTYPQQITIAGNVIFPPDDTKPAAQTITLTPSYLFYNYQDTGGAPRTLVYSFNSKGWSVDTYSPPVNCHLNAMAGSGALLLTGCTDGTVRQLGGRAEVGTTIIATRSDNGGDARAGKRVGDVFFKGEIQSGFPVQVQLWKSQFTRQLIGFAPPSLTGTGLVTYYTVDFMSGFGSDVDDIGAVLSWPLLSDNPSAIPPNVGNVIDLWQPDWIPLPEVIQDRPSDWTECGVPGNKLIRGMIIEMDTFNTAKAIQVERSDTAMLVAPNQASVTVNGQTLVPFTFDPPFTAHMLRIVSTDGVQWRMWGSDAIQWIVDQWPEYTPLYGPWQNLGVDGAKYIRSLLIPMDTNSQPAQFTVQTSDGQAVTFDAVTGTAVKTPVPFAFLPPIVAHEVQLQCLSNAGLWTEEIKWFFDPYPEIIPAYTPIMEVSGSGNKYVRGIKIVFDSADLLMHFRVVFDGGQAGPLLGPTASDGKGTVPFAFDPPFIAHDLQIIPDAPVRIWMPGMGAEDVSEWIYDPWPDYTPLYSAWLNLGQEGAKYLRSMVIPMDTNGATANIMLRSSNGDEYSFSATTLAARKTPVPFAIVPPLVVHEVQLICESNAGLWSEEVKWLFDPYPELIPAYTPVMEISGPDNKFMQGIKIVADTSFTAAGDINPQPVQFQILYDGQQVAMVLEPRRFTGKQTQVYSFNPPFEAHDVQLVPLQPVRIWMPGMGAEDVSEWVFQPFPESATTWDTEASSLGLYGWCHLYQVNLAYISTTPVTLTVNTDQGPFTLTYPPSTGGPTTPSKVLLKCPRNKWKLISFSATSTVAFSLWKAESECWIKSWGSTGEYQKTLPFGGPSSPEAAI